MKTTERPSAHHDLEKMSVLNLLKRINQEDEKVPRVIRKSIPQIEKIISAAEKKIKSGGRLFYIGAGTSGRLGIVDASECPPTFGVRDDLIIGIIAGGDKAIRKAVEFAEDDRNQGWKDLQFFKINPNDFVIGLSASGNTPYVISALEKCRKKNIQTGCICCNKKSVLAEIVAFPVEIIVGPEFITGSTRMKAGTAQKLVLNMISTSLMIRLGHVLDNKMVDMQLTNDKLIERGTKMLTEKLNLTETKAKKILLQNGSVRKAIKSFNDKRKK
jgi:N-acetylmuramic acid 6-phosphate etherase